MARIAKRQDAVKSQESQPHISPAGEVLTSLIVPVIRLEAYFSRAGETIAAAGGQTLARWLVLETVGEVPATVAQIARGLGYTRQSVQRVADLLAHDRLTQYAVNPAHQRSQLVRITPRGRKTLASIQRAQRVWADRTGSEIGEAELRQASSVVDNLTRILKAQ
ncbi:MAG TPA: MarR family transcriptional regulator [Chloroflexota bacterium]|jgi:DNA-binding MarR family transcriptional regulator|nr:MarR family transcriptional regulator [Chloroflexota bacterium]